jgi:hypothetical protein
MSPPRVLQVNTLGSESLVFFLEQKHGVVVMVVVVG